MGGLFIASCLRLLLLSNELRNVHEITLTSDLVRMGKASACPSGNTREAIGYEMGTQKTFAHPTAAHIILCSFLKR